jgi:phytoene dehydrogenase-like protein
MRQKEFVMLAECLQHWLPDPRKVQLLVTTYLGTLLAWCTQDHADFPAMLRSNLGWAWAGLRADSPADENWSQGTTIKEEPQMKVAIIGGGLAGLTAAAYLSECPGAEGVLFERSPQLGGRAFTYEKAGFTLNYGAHAIYGIDRHTISVLERELGLSFSSKQVDKRRVMYAKNDQLTEAPLDFINLMKTELLNTRQKVRFVAEITAIIANIHQLKNYPTLGDYLAESDADEDVKELWEHLVCSNFFITPEEARKVSGSVISDYYHNLFLSSRPVNYVLGSWAVITNQLRQKITGSGRWEIALQEGVDSIRYADRKFILATKSREVEFDRVVFAMPVQQVVKLLKGTAWEPFMSPYESNTATEAMVYDIGLERVVARPFSYISDMDNKMFITDVSATDHTLIPEGGQLLQGIAYLSDGFHNEEERKAYLDRKTAQMEALFDRHYPGWRDAVAVKRVSKKAMVASVKNIASNSLLPNRVENVPFYFCGDGCVGKGELAERAFSSARTVAKAIAEDARALVGTGV